MINPEYAFKMQDALYKMKQNIICAALNLFCGMLIAYFIIHFKSSNSHWYVGVEVGWILGIASAYLYCAYKDLKRYFVYRKFIFETMREKAGE